MRERIEMKSKMLGALALLTLIGALFVMQSAEQQSATTVDAATGTIAAMNVGTCLTTDTDVPSFSGDCTALDDSVEGRDIRDKITEVSTLYATYAHDPKTASEEPRAILKDSDLLKISIKDEGRDKRSGVLIRGASNDTKLIDDNTKGSLGKVIRDDLVSLKVDFDTHDPKSSGENPDTDVIKFNSDEHLGLETSDGIEVYRGMQSEGSSVVMDSGNHTLNFSRTGTDGSKSPASAWQFDPADFDVANGAVVRFYGCLDGNADGDCGESGETIKRLTELTVDEDASNGNASGDLAPWLGVNASVPTGKDIIILAIYYRTSSEESLIGGEAYSYGCASGAKLKRTTDADMKLTKPITTPWKCETVTNGKTSAENAKIRNQATNVVYTSGEKVANTALHVRVKSDGDDLTQNLHLKEKGRFSGVYQGFVRLTDANGDGRGTGPARTDWGHETKAGKNATDPNGTNGAQAEPTVLGVESGPVTIEYRDSSGNNRTLRIEIDNHPPVVNITSPANNSWSDDQSPDFAGTFEDGDSGLVSDSFRLVVDNEVDGPDGKNDAAMDNFALKDRAPTAKEVKGTGDGTGHVTYIAQYSGHKQAYVPGYEGFGVVDASDLYKLGDDSCSNQDICHVLAESHSDGATSGSFDDTLRLDLRDGGQDANIRDSEFQIDFQAFALDMAGNVGFSDSDASNPRFINDLGVTKVEDRNVPNVLGYYSAHITTLDEKDPELVAAKTATGIYGHVSGDEFTPDRSGIRVAFDGPIDPDSVGNSTFSVTLDDGTAARVIDHDVDKNWVFLKLGSELASDATPMIDIATGEKVEDLAGNETFGREVDAFEVNDGISPVLTVTLSGGSGKGTGNEGSDKLTKDTITVHVSSDEDLQSAPRIVVVCSSLQWGEDDGRHDIDDFVANRNTWSSVRPGETPKATPRPSSGTTAPPGSSYGYTCGYDPSDRKFPEDFEPVPFSSLSRPGNTWEFTWQNLTNVSQKLENGELTAVAFGRDRGGYDNLENWGSSSAEFTYDTELKDPLNTGGLQPADGGKSKEARPFILIEFSESTTVTLDSVELDGVEIASQFESPDMNRFIYWPLSMSQGEHNVDVDASDAAGNPASFSYDFEILARGDFVISLNAGWNAISVPADPNDTAIGSVFTDPAVTTVIGWDTQGWRIATRRDGVWESNQSYGALNEIRAMYGYWVKSDNFVRQPVALRGGNARDTSGTPILVSIPTEPGWNFVGVVDQDGDQTEDDFGNSLKGSDNAMIPAKDYLGSTYVRAYSWDATFSRFDVIRPDDVMSIGDGVWVYYPEGTGIAP